MHLMFTNANMLAHYSQSKDMAAETAVRSPEKSDSIFLRPIDSYFWPLFDVNQCIL